MSIIKEFKFWKNIDPMNMIDFNDYMKTSSFSNLYISNYILNTSNISILVNSNMSASDSNTMSNWIGNYIPSSNLINVIENQSIVIKCGNVTTTNGSWETLFSWAYPGLCNQSCKKIRFIADTTSGNYSIRCYNTSNNTDVFTFTGSNTNKKIYTITTLSNLPEYLAELEIHAKVDGLFKTCTFHNLSIVT